MEGEYELIHLIRLQLYLQKKQQMKQQYAELIADTGLPTTISIKAVQLFPLTELIT